MGCSQSSVLRNSKSTDSITIGNDIELLVPDPDLGWRRVPNLGNTSGVALGTLHTNLADWVTEDDFRKQSTQSYPENWIAHFFNDRSGLFCQVSVSTLAINICIRAQRLAVSFGVVDTSNLSKHRDLSAEFVMEDFVIPRRQIYTALDIPDYGWTLQNRTVYTQDQSNTKNGTKQNLGMQLITNRDGKKLLADVPTIGMNIAEQLHRLERKQDNRHYLPNHTFGWQINTPMGPDGLQICVIDNTGNAFWIIPEEIIMNVTQWVQQTYLTSAVL